MSCQRETFTTGEVIKEIVADNDIIACDFDHVK